MPHNIEGLDIYKRAHLLTIGIYRVTREFPKEELYGLVSQMRRAAVSINSNLMEGGHRNSDGEYKNFIGIALGSIAELKYQVLVSKDLNYITYELFCKINKELKEIESMLVGLNKSIK